MPNRHVGQLIRLYDRIRGAFHPARDAKRMQEMAHQGSFPSPKIAMQSDEGVAERRRLRQGVCKRLCRRFVRPKQAQWQSFYNRRVNTHNAQASPPPPQPPTPPLLGQLQAWAQELGFSQIGIAGVDLSSAEPGLLAWLEHGFHGEMDYMERHGLKRARPAQLLAGTLSVITARMDYLPSQTPKDWQALEFAGLSKFDQGTVSVYARGRDYHKVVRQRLQQLAERLSQHIGFEFLQMLRLRLQLESEAALVSPNEILVATLNDIDRRILRESIKVAHRIQQRLQLDYER